jgi:hypothetical protein
VVRIEEIPVNKEEVLNKDKESNKGEEDYAEEEGNTEESIEGDAFEDNAEDEIHRNQDNSKSRAR